jgi:hypothetical protein
LPTLTNSIPSPPSWSHKISNREQQYFELEKIDFNRMVDTFQRVYPSIFKALEDRWKDEVDLHTNLLEYYESQGLKCKHK